MCQNATFLNKKRLIEFMTSKLKRLPYNSYTIIMKFENNEERDECIKSEKFKAVAGKLASKLGTNYNCTIEFLTY